MPKELKELKAFTQGNITAMGAEEIPDEAASYSLDVDNNSEFGILQGRHEDLMINSAHSSGHYYGTISRFTPLIDDKVYKDLVFVKLISGVRALNSGLASNEISERIITDDASPPYKVSIGIHPKFLESGNTESIRVMDVSSNGDISMESTGKALHVGFGGDNSAAGPKWVGHFGHNRFDYAWNKAYPYIEEDWISTKDFTKDMDIIAHSYEDAYDYDPSTYSQGTMHHYVLAGALSGNSLVKIDVSVSPPAIVRETPTDFDGINCITQAWNRFSSNALIAHSEGSIHSETFTTGVGGWNAITSFGSLTDTNDKANITPNGSGIGKISHKFNAKKGDKFTLEFDSLELASVATLKYSIGTTEGGTDIVNEETLASGSSVTTLARKDIVEQTTSGDSSTTYYLEADAMDGFSGSDFIASGNRFYVTTEDASNKVQTLYLTLIIVNSSGTAVSKFDGVKLLGCCNNVGDNSNIDGYWVFYGEYQNTPTGYGYGALAKINRTTLAIESTRLISGWGHTWMNSQRTWHDGHYGNSTGGYISQIMQCGEKVWFNVKTDSLKGGFVAARPKEIRIHDGYYQNGIHFDSDTGATGSPAKQYLHGQIALLYNVDIPYTGDGLSEIRPDNRTPDSCLGLNNVEDAAPGDGSGSSPSFHIPSVEHPGYQADANSAQEFSNGVDSYEHPQGTSSHNYYTRASKCHDNAVMSNMSWMTESFAKIKSGTSGDKSIAYKTYRMSMARIPDSKCGINWFFSAGSVSAGTGSSFPSYNSEDVKVAAYVGIPKYSGDSDKHPHVASSDGGLAGLFSGQIALHYLATVGPRYQNVHRVLQKNDVFTNNLTSLETENGLLVEGEQLRLDSVGQQYVWSGDGSGGYFNINEALGGKTTSPTRILGETYNGSVWKSDLPVTNSHTNYGTNIRISMTEVLRRHGFSRYCTLAPVDLCFAEMLDLKGDIKSGNAEYIGVETGATPDSVKWYNVRSEPLEAIGAIDSTSWEDARETTSYKESLSQENAFYSGPNHRKYPNDHYDDVVGITMVPYLNHENNIFRGALNVGWLNNTWESSFSGIVTGSNASWTGGVKLAVLVSKDGTGAWRMPNSPNNYGGGAPSILGLNDANRDGEAGGACRISTMAFWDNTRLNAKVPNSSTRTVQVKGYLKGNNQVDTEGPIHCPHFMPGMLSSLTADSIGTVYFGMSVARPYSPHFILTNGANGTDNFTGNVDVYAANASWGNDMNPDNPEDIHNNNTFAFVAEGGVGKIVTSVGAGQFDMYSKGWNGFYYNGYELWGRETLGATGDAVSSSNLNALAVTSGDQVTANPIFQIRGETSGKLVISGNIAKPHSTIEAESSGSIGSSDTGNNVSPGYSEDAAYNDDGDASTPLTGNALYTTANAHYNDLEHWYSGSIADGVGVTLNVSLSGNDSDGEFMAEKHYHYKYAFLYDGNQETPLSTQTKGEADNSIKYRHIQIILTKNTLPKRITHITIYRAQSSSALEQERDEPFRLIKQIPLTTGPNGENSTAYPGFKDHTEAGKSIYKVQAGQPHIVDNGNIGSSYQAINGMSETIEDFRVYYGLSTQINGQHWIARCWREELEGGERYVMWSKPGKFSTFNWLEDYLRLPTVPTALAAFNGRVYAWDEGNMYRIDPSLGKVEDILEGVGCIGPNAVTVTDYGMIFCDKNNIYLHDGQTAKAIGDPILNNTSRDNVVLSTPSEEQEDGYQKLAANAMDNPMWNKPRIWTSWAGQCNSFIVGITSQIGTKKTFLYTYKPSLNRWDKWSIYLDGDEITSIFVGFDGQCYFPTTGQTTQTSGLSRLLGQKYQNVVNEGMRKAFKWHSKRITMGSSTQKKKFKNLKASGNQDIPNDTSGTPSEIKVYLDNKVITSSVSSTDLSSGVTDEEKYYLNEYNAGPNDSKDFYGLKIKVEGNKDLKLESLGVIYRRKTIK